MIFLMEELIGPLSITLLQSKFHAQFISLFVCKMFSYVLFNISLEQILISYEYETFTFYLINKYGDLEIFYRVR